MPDFGNLLEAAKIIADTEGFSSPQIKEMSKAQMASHLGLSPSAKQWSSGNYGRFTAIRTNLFQYVLGKEDKAVAQSIKNKLTVNEIQWIADNIRMVKRHLGFIEEEDE